MKQPLLLMLFRIEIKLDSGNSRYKIDGQVKRIGNIMVEHEEGCRKLKL